MKRLPVFLILILLMFTSACGGSGSGDTARAQIVLDNIANRKSVRSYTSQPVSDEMVEKLLRAAMAAPSAMNVQPWEFVVVKDRATLDTLASRLRYAKMLAQAPLAIVVCADTVSTDKNGNLRENDLWMDDASAATENLLLAAEALGLGAVWTAACDRERSDIVREVLGIPDSCMPLSVVPVGYPAGREQPKDKWKPEKIHYEKW